MNALSPLDQLLDRLARGHIHYLDALASELAIERDLLEHMLLQLEHSGYVERVRLDCTHACAGCAQACSHAPSGRMWQVTPSGLRAAQSL